MNESIPNIFVVTVMEDGGKHPRSVGWLPTIDAALQAVATNSGSMHECRYSYLLIEETACGTFSVSDKQWWFEWRNDSWMQISEPEKGAIPSWAIGIVNWGLG